MRVIRNSVLTLGLLGVFATPVMAQEDPKPEPQPQPQTTEPEKGATGGANYGGVNYGQEESKPAPAPQPLPPAEPVAQEPVEEPHHHRLFAPGLGFSVGGGVSDFANDEMRGMTDTGGTWDARLIIAPRSLLSLEAAYVGTAQNIQALGLNDATLVSNGIEGNLRLNVPMARISPFGFVGAGWSQYDVSETGANLSSVNDTDDVTFVPFGGGIAGHYHGLMMDARYTYRAAYDEDLIDTTTASGRNGQPSLDNWSVSGRVGFEF